MHASDIKLSKELTNGIEFFVGQAVFIVLNKNS